MPTSSHCLAPDYVPLLNVPKSMDIKAPSTPPPPASSHIEESGLKGCRCGGPAAHLPTGHPPTLFFFPPPLAGAGAEPRPQPHLHCALLSSLSLPTHASAIPQFSTRASLQSTLLLLGAGGTETSGEVEKASEWRVQHAIGCLSTAQQPLSATVLQPCSPRAPVYVHPTALSKMS